DGAGIFMLDLGLVIPLVMVVALDEAVLTLDEAGASVAVSLDPGPASIPSWSAGFRRGMLPIQYPEVLVVAKVAGDAVAATLVDVEVKNTGVSSRWWLRNVILPDDEEVLMLL